MVKERDTEWRRRGKPRRLEDQTGGIQHKTTNVTPTTTNGGEFRPKTKGQREQNQRGQGRRRTDPNHDQSRQITPNEDESTPTTTNPDESHPTTMTAEFHSVTTTRRPPREFDEWTQRLEVVPNDDIRDGRRVRKHGHNDSRPRQNENDLAPDDRLGHRG